MKSIALVVNFEKDSAREAALSLTEALAGRAAVYCDLAGGGLLPVKALPDSELFTLCPTVVTLGGDGTIISTAGRCAPYGNVLVGINLGRLGFLATVEAGDIGRAADFILSDVKYRERTMLACRIRRADGSLEAEHHALNDVVLSRGAGRLHTIEAEMDGRPLTRVRADGLVAATPTGSTAYSLSAGGPIAAPDMDIFILSPICPHNLTARPMVLPTDRTISLSAGEDAVITVDGRNIGTLHSGDRAEIRKSPYITRLAEEPGGDFYELVRKKLTNI